MNNNLFYFLIYLLKSIIMAVVTLYIAIVIGVIATLIMKGYLFDLTLDVFYIPDYRIILWGIICGIGNLILFSLSFFKSITRGEDGLEFLNKKGYQAEINEISPNIKIPFYKIDGELFYNYAPFARSISVMLNGIKRVTKYADPKNLVINMVDSSVKLEKLQSKVLAKFDNKLDKILIIDKSGSVIKLK